MLKNIRRLLAFVSFSAMVLLFLNLCGYGVWLPSIQLIPAILATNFVAIVFILALTLFFGRIYCSVICPLGILQDILARFCRFIKRDFHYSYRPHLTRLRYGFLACFCLLWLIGGFFIVELFDPYSIFGRIMTTLLTPIWSYICNALVPILDEYEILIFIKQSLAFSGIGIVAFTLIFFIAIAILSIKHGRMYCNAICPVGAVLGFLSKFALLRLEIDKSKCISCGKCSRECKSECIDFKSQEIDSSRRVACFDCMNVCDRAALGFTKHLARIKVNSAGIGK